MEHNQNHNGHEWETIEVPSRPSHVIKPIRWDDHVVLLNYVYSTKLDAYIHMQTFEVIDGKHFDETYEALEMPRGKQPANYIRQDHDDTRKVYSMDMNCSTNLRIYQDEQEKFILNTYMPLSIATISNADYKKPTWFIDHLLYILNNDQNQVDHVLKFIAHLLFRPADRIESGIVISGIQGSGKSFIYKVLERLIGIKNCNQVNPDDLTAKFKDDWIGKRLLCVEEVKKNDKSEHGYYNKIKTIFTNEHITFDIKMKNKLRVQNYLHYIFFSNHANPIKFEANDRRFFYVHSKLKKEDLKSKEYYKELFSYINNKEDTLELSSLMKYLKDEIVPTLPEDFHTADAPDTSDKTQAVDATSDQLIVWLKSELELKKKGTYFEKGMWFEMKDFNEDLPLSLKYLLKNSNYVPSTLKEYGLTQIDNASTGRPTILGRKYTPYFFDYSERILNTEFWKDKSEEGIRRKSVRQIKSPVGFGSIK